MHHADHTDHAYHFHHTTQHNGGGALENEPKAVGVEDARQRGDDRALDHHRRHRLQRRIAPEPGPDDQRRECRKPLADLVGLRLAR